MESAMIDAERVREITKGSLFHKTDLPDDYKVGDKPENAIMIEGVVNMYGFNPDRVKRYKNEVKGILAQLPESFKNGDSFLNGCVDKDGNQWGEQFDVECLMCIGMALGYVTCPFPRNQWHTLYGEMPYYQTHIDEKAEEKT
jgi:hypothetical protein